MTSDVIQRLVISRNGQYAVLITQDAEGWYSASRKHVDVLNISAQTRPNEATTQRFSIMVGRGVSGSLRPESLGLPSGTDNAIDILVEVAIGEYLDELHQPPKETTEVIEIHCFDEFFERIRTRRRASNEAVREYLALKTWWAWELDQDFAIISYPEHVRLRCPAVTLHKIALSDQGIWWDFPLDPLIDSFGLTPTYKLLERFRQALVPLAPGPVIDLVQQLREAGHTSASAQWAKALQFLTDAPDYENAVKECISAVETLAKLVTGTSGTLGHAIKEIGRYQVLHPRLISLLEALWAYTNQAPGIRHGHADNLRRVPAEAHFAVNLCGAVILFLLELQTLQGAWSTREPALPTVAGPGVRKG